MERVTVKHMFNGEIDEEFPDIGVFYEDRGVVIQCDPWGSIELYEATRIEGTDVVVVQQGADDLCSDNPEFVVNLILGGTK